jgi:hypothetical protein
MSTASPTTKDTQKTTKPANGINGAHTEAEFPLTVNVPPRQPQLAWQRMDRKELADLPSAQHGIKGVG